MVAGVRRKAAAPEIDRGPCRLGADAGVSPDGKWIASGGNDHLVKIWNAADGTLGARAGRPREPRLQHFFHPSGALLSGDLQGELRQWDVATGRTVRTFDAQGAAYVRAGAAGRLRGRADAGPHQPTGNISSRAACSTRPTRWGPSTIRSCSAFQWGDQKKLRSARRCRASRESFVWRVITHPDGFSDRRLRRQRRRIYRVLERAMRRRISSAFRCRAVVRDLDLHPDGIRLAASPVRQTAAHPGDGAQARLKRASRQAAFFSNELYDVGLVADDLCDLGDAVAGLVQVAHHLDLGGRTLFSGEARQCGGGPCRGSEYCVTSGCRVEPLSDISWFRIVERRTISRSPATTRLSNCKARVSMRASTSRAKSCSRTSRWAMRPSARAWARSFSSVSTREVDLPAVPRPNVRHNTPPPQARIVRQQDPLQHTDIRGQQHWQFLSPVPGEAQPCRRRLTVSVIMGMFLSQSCE